VLAAGRSEPERRPLVMEAPGSHVVKRAHLSRSSSRKILDQPDTGIGRTGHGEEVRQRLVSRSQLLWTWAHFLSAIGLIGGVTAGVIVIWTQLDEQGLVPRPPLANALPCLPPLAVWARRWCSRSASHAVGVGAGPGGPVHRVWAESVPVPQTAHQLPGS
jgi:hypothetical protein